MSEVRFERVRSVAELDARVAQAAAAGKPVLLDFYADWCVSCKEMERFTFTDERVRARLSEVVMLQADVTRNNPDDRALLKRFGLFGPRASSCMVPTGASGRSAQSAISRPRGFSTRCRAHSIPRPIPEP